MDISRGWRGRPLFAAILALGALLAGAPAIAPAEPNPGFLVEPGKAAPEPLLRAVRDALGGGPLPAVTLVHFVSCESMRCEESLRAISEHVHAPMQDEDAAVVAIAVKATAAEAEALAARLELAFPLLADEDGALFSQIADQGVPRTLMLDDEGAIVYAHAGFAAGREAEYRFALEALLDDEKLPFDLDARLAGVPDVDPALLAKDVRGKPMPDIPIEHWVTEPPDHDGKYLLVDFWATWCPPCRESLRQGEELHEEFADRLVTWAISDEGLETVSEFVRKQELAQPVGLDTQARGLKALQIQGIPHGLLVAPEGTVVWQGNPLELWAAEGARLRELLDGAE